MGWLKDLFMGSKEESFHRRAQRAESDAIHLLRQNQNLQMRLDYAVEAVKQARETTVIYFKMYRREREKVKSLTGVTNLAQGTASDQQVTKLLQSTENDMGTLTSASQSPNVSSPEDITAEVSAITSRSVSHG